MNVATRLRETLSGPEVPLSHEAAKSGVVDWCDQYDPAPPQTAETQTSLWLKESRLATAAISLIVLARVARRFSR